MNAPIQTLIELGVIPPVSFPADSRYHGSPTLTYVTPGGRPHLSRPALSAPTRRAELFNDRPAYRQTRRPARSSRSEISGRSALVLGSAMPMARFGQRNW